MNGERKRIFVVEDQRLIAADLENTLRKLGYDVAGNAATGEEAVERVLSTEVDLVLMDIRLRGAMDGIEAAAAIRQRRDVPIVYLTAYADEETVVRAKATSPFGYVVKPFNERELRAAIEIALFKHDTDRQLLEERARRRYAEELRMIVDAVRDYAIFRLDRDGRISTWNDGAERIEGHRADEVIGQPFALFYETEDVHAGRPQLALRVAEAQGSIEDEGYRVRKDGARFWANVVITAVRDERGRLDGFGVVMRDCTEKKRQEDLRVFLDRATVALASSLDYTDTLGRAARVSIPELADFCVLVLPNDRDRPAQAAAAHANPNKEPLLCGLGPVLDRVLDARSGVYPVRVTGRAKLYALDHATQDGSALDSEDAGALRALDARSCITATVQLRGRAAGVLYLLRGTASQPHDGQDLLVAGELAQRIGMAIDNARLFQETQQAIRARDEFLQIASHELRTPLTPLQLQLDTLVRAVARSGEENERFTQRLQAATRQTERLSRLVETVLDVARITSGRFALHSAEFDFAAMVRELAERLDPEAARAKCEVRIEGDDAVLGAWDRDRMEQMVTNLLLNAFKYGSGKPVELELRASPDTVRLSVRDHGIGIDPEAVERIFGRFERAVSLRNFGGLGLGLFVAKQIVDAHGGSIVVHSQPGDGATFTVVLPRQPAASAGVPDPAGTSGTH